jgi:hypothetical protein
MTNITQNSSITSMDRKSVFEFVVYKESTTIFLQKFDFSSLLFENCKLWQHVVLVSIKCMVAGWP